MPSNKKLLQAAAGNAGESLYVEDIFSTYLYAGNDAYQTITNGIDLLNEGGLVWTKSRTTADRNNYWWDTERGYTSGDTNFTGHTLSSNTTSGEQSGEHVRNIYEDGYQSWGGYHVNMSGQDYVSWTFRKAEKFFDVVTYTGTGGTAHRQIAHNLGSTPAAVILKNTTDSSYWYVYHKDTAQPGDTNYATHGAYLNLDRTVAKNFSNTAFPKVGTSSGGVTAVYDSSVFTIGEDLNVSGKAYVLYLFASDAGGFGDDGSENIIKCGSYTGSGGSGQEINLGFEPQWVLVKNTSRAGQNWVIVDNMRQFDNTGYGWLYPNSSAAETSGTGAVYASPTATGFKTYGNNAAFDYLTDSYIYIAIRRPMKTPESGTEVFATAQRDTTAPIFEGGFSVDAAIIADVSGAWTNSPSMGSRLTGTSRLATSNANAAGADGLFMWDYMNGWGDGSGSYPEYYSWMFKRATGFMDVVAYTGNATVRTVPHNLGVVPELMIVKKRNTAKNWYVYSAADSTKYLYLNGTNAFVSGSAEQIFGNDSTTVAPTSSVFSLGSQAAINGSGDTFINYLFASVAGVSKVGSYTGTGADLNVDCGFSAGARFVLIKRTDSSGDWYVWDTERGIVAGNDPYLLLNSSAAQVTNTDYIDPLSSGFTVTSSAPAALNASGGTYIFLAIA